MRGRRTERVEMICTNEECDMYNEEVIRRYSAASWDDPSEWWDDPICDECQEDLKEVY